MPSVCSLNSIQPVAMVFTCPLANDAFCIVILTVHRLCWPGGCHSEGWAREISWSLAETLQLSVSTTWRWWVSRSADARLMMYATWWQQSPVIPMRSHRVTTWDAFVLKKSNDEPLCLATSCLTKFSEYKTRMLDINVSHLCWAY